MFLHPACAELAVAWLYQHDRTLTVPYQDHLSALIHEPSFRQAVGPAVFAKAKLLKDLGNQAVHSTRPVRQYDALTAVRELFHFCFWLTRTYARGAKPADGFTLAGATAQEGACLRINAYSPLIPAVRRFGCIDEHACYLHLDCGEKQSVRRGYDALKRGIAGTSGTISS